MQNTVLLKLSDHGEPVQAGPKNGVLILPTYLIKKGKPLVVLDIQLDGSAVITNSGELNINVPKENETFDRRKFQKIPLKRVFHEDITISVPIYRPGSFSYFIAYESYDGQKLESREIYFNVPPQIVLQDELLPFNGLNIETVVSKWMGGIDKWEDIFKEIAFKGFNMIHFTPLQVRGSSNSPYSIFDQLSFDKELFRDNDDAIATLKSKLGKFDLLSLTDVVWNHTADNSEWIRHAPEAGYNAETAPHLKAAIELDGALLDFSANIEKLGFTSDIKTQEDLDSVLGGIDQHVLQPLNLWQFYVFDKKSILGEIAKSFDNRSLLSPIDIPSDVDINDKKKLAQFVLKEANIRGKVVLNDRFSNTLESSKVLSIILSLGKLENADLNLDYVLTKGTEIIDNINVDLYTSYDDDILSIKNQLKDRIRYLRLDENGPKLGPVTEEKPLTEAYFTRFTDNNGKEWQLANNGWIWGGNPLDDFASDKSKAYLRREVIVWSDCIKLRYGEKAEDSPVLWSRMEEYTKLCASVFNGFRIDNCHSTPLHVGQRLLDLARSVNPNLYVVAELFSGSEEMDKIFVERLGINSLIREAMQAWTVEELSTLVHKHGGRPIGSFTWLPLDDFAYLTYKRPQVETRFDSYSQVGVPKVLIPQEPHALFMDCTHDNEPPYQKRTVEDTLPNAALVSFCSSAIGSVFGYDEGYPSLLNLVSETRTYSYGQNGIRELRRRLNSVRKSLIKETKDIGRDHEMYIHHEGQYITIQRYNTRTGKGWFLIARTKFTPHYAEQSLNPVNLVGTKAKLSFSYCLQQAGDFKDDSEYLKGVPTEVKEVTLPDIIYENGNSHITIDNSFVPGSIAVYETEIPGVDARLDDLLREGAFDVTKDLTLYDLNNILYRSEAEERDSSMHQDGTYDIPGYGKIVYAGLQGWISVLKYIIWENNLSHPLADHLRNGKWALDYTHQRLDKYAKDSESLKTFQEWLRERMERIKEQVPYYLIPHYFALVVGVAYEACRFRALQKFPKDIQLLTSFIQSLALVSIQMVSTMKSTSLLPFSLVPSMAAGLPHFSTEYMRCWGRDVFISFRGLLLVTGRFDDARQHILAFARTLKHGLIPNLLDAGREPRYNARDAAWFFLQSVKDYVEFVPNGSKILKEKVPRRFPLDDTYITVDDSRAFSYETSIHDIIYEILSRHAKGIKYREAKAGPNLDSQMSDEGFNVEVNVDWKTGFIHGGSQFNCGTWMDKMGESEKAGNKGVPGTPRDGAAIEIQGLLKSVLLFVNKLHEKGEFSYNSVEKSDGHKMLLTDWETLLQENFEKKFYVPENAEQDHEYDIDTSIVNRRGIYKDLYKTGKPYEDYQLRANFPIAMTVAPELFTPSKALTALKIADEVIRGPVGMRTLDPSDWNYRPNYVNSEDSDDFATAKGRNYHQGPEWVWLTGYFLRAFTLFHWLHSSEGKAPDGKPSLWLLSQLGERLRNLDIWLKNSPWAGLPELTNKDGAFCNDSSPTQAWSASGILDLYYDLHNRFV